MISGTPQRTSIGPMIGGEPSGSLVASTTIGFSLPSRATAYASGSSAWPGAASRPSTIRIAAAAAAPRIGPAFAAARATRCASSSHPLATTVQMLAVELDPADSGAAGRSLSPRRTVT